jgi:CheY-like chemotaxis protein
VAAESVPRQAQFVFRTAVETRVRVTRHALVARVLATAPARIAATLDGAHYRRIQRWSFPAKAGATVRTLRLRERLRPGVYTLYWSGRTADGSVYRTSQKIRAIAARAKAHTKHVPVVAVVPSEQGSLGPGTLLATPEESFDVVARRDASVVIVDVDAYGIALVRDLRRVFPDTSVIAISKSASTRSAARRAGAVVAKPSTPATKLRRLVARLARG